MKRGVSPYASGGGGVTLERRVAALYLARLLTGTTAPELDGRRVTRVAFQQGPEHAVDDLLVCAAREDGADPLRLAVAVRRAPSFQARDQATEKLVRTFVQDLAAAASPDGHDSRLAVCVGGSQAAAKQVATLAAHARSQAGADGFFRLVRTPECFERAVAERLGHVLALVTAALRALGRDASPAAAEAVTWRLLTRLDVLMPRVEPPDETDWTGALIDQLTPWARAATPDAAISLRDRLESLAARYAPVAADVDRALLCRDAREALGERTPVTVRTMTATPAPYLEQVRQIAPDVLRDREAELAELASFCTAPDPHQGPYTWWRAEAWSGKSALLSWLVLNPPPRTRVVAFFVTARWGAQNDRAAFTDAVSEQLAHLLGEPIPATLTDTTRYGTLLRLLRDAAHLCQDNGERLLLVVDGLDEDRGIDGPNGHSIAGLLPASPPAGCRIVVASRPNPPVPLDVPDNHPLRDPGILRPLAPSAHVGGVRSAMERELHQMLETPFGRDLLGLLLAAGGGLSARDFAELTTATEYEVTWRLKTSAARSFSPRPPRWGHPDADPVYILAHEELRVIATKALGPRTIAGYRDSLHRWAGGYRADRWPADTPEYLLDGYHRMLIAEGEIARATDCATDRDRYQRVRCTTGGDSTVLTEISASLDAWKQRADPDLRAMTRLAMHRDVLSDRNRLIPGQLPGLWAKLGELSRAEAMARSLPGAIDRARALTDVAETLAAAGYHDRARAVAIEAMAPAEAIPHSVSQGMWPSVAMLIGLARTLRTVGAEREASAALHAAETAAAVIAGNEGDRARSMAQVARVLREEGGHDRASALLGRAERFARAAGTSWYGRGSALATIALALEEAGQHERARAVASDAAHAIAAIPDDWHVSFSEYSYVTVISDVATALMRVGDRDQALAVLQQAGTIVRALAATGEFKDVCAMARLARVMHDLGDAQRALDLLDRAQAAADAVAERYERMRALAELGQVLAEFGDLDRAVEVIGRAEAVAVDSGSADWGEAALWTESALVVIARALERSGPRPRAHLMLDKAEAIVRSASFGGLRWQAARLTSIALVWEATGERDRAASVAAEAGSLAETSTDLRRLGRTLAEVGQALAEAGFREPASTLAGQVEAIARTVEDDDDRDGLLGLAARAFTAARDHGHAQAVVDKISAPDHLIETLAKMAGIVESCGEHDRATLLVRRADALAALKLIPAWGQASRTSVVRVLGTIGDFGQAEALARSIPDPGEQAMALAGLSQSMIALGAADRAALIVSSIPDPDPDDGRGRVTSDLEWMRAARIENQWTAKIHALSDMARAWNGQGEPRRAADMARSAEELAAAAPRPGLVRDAIPSLARALAAAGERGKAKDLVGSVADEDSKAQVLLAIAKEASPEDARGLIAETLVLGRWTRPLEALAEIEPDAVLAVAEEFSDLVAPALARIPVSAV